MSNDRRVTTVSKDSLSPKAQLTSCGDFLHDSTREGPGTPG